MRVASIPKGKKYVPKQVVAIPIGDLHLRMDKTPCQKEGFYERQMEKLGYLVLVSNKYKAPLLLPGDVFHKSDTKIPPKLLADTISVFGEAEIQPIAVCGQHDLSFHSKEYYQHSGLAVLAAAGVVDVLCHAERVNSELRQLGKTWRGKNVYLMGLAYGASYSTDLDSSAFVGIEEDDLLITLQHKMVFDKSPYPDAEKAGNISVVHSEYTGANLCVFGDNHEFISVPLPNNPPGILNLGRFTTQSIKERSIPQAYAIIYNDATYDIKPFPKELKDELENMPDSETEDTEDHAELNEFIDSIHKPADDSETFLQAFYKWKPKNEFQTNIKTFICDLIQEIKNDK